MREEMFGDSWKRNGLFEFWNWNDYIIATQLVSWVFQLWEEDDVKNSNHTRGALVYYVSNWFKFFKSVCSTHDVDVSILLLDDSWNLKKLRFVRWIFGIQLI